jgi:hypothetical protein
MPRYSEERKQIILSKLQPPKPIRLGSLAVDAVFRAFSINIIARSFHWRWQQHL